MGFFSGMQSASKLSTHKMFFSAPDTHIKSTTHLIWPSARWTTQIPAQPWYS